MKNLRLTPDFFRPSAMPKAGVNAVVLLLDYWSGSENIQELLGHGSSKPTEIYVRITKKGFERNNTVLLSHTKKGAQQHTITK